MNPPVPPAGSPARAHAHAWPQTLIGAGVLLTGVALGAGAVSIPSDAGYGGVGPNFLPWVVAAVLGTCGVWMIVDSLRGGFTDMEDAPTGTANWPAFAWVSAGLLSNAALITTVGFILSCTLCYVLAAQGLRRAEAAPGERRAGTSGAWIRDIVTGALISAPVYWTFTKFLAINLPGLTSSGWL